MHGLINFRLSDINHTYWTIRKPLTITYDYYYFRLLLGLPTITITYDYYYLRQE